MAHVFRPPWGYAAQAAARAKRRFLTTTATPAGAESYPSQQKVVSIFRKPTRRVFRTILQGPDWRDLAAPVWSSGPSLQKHPDGTITVAATITDVTNAKIDRAYVILPSGSSAPSATEVWDLTGNASGWLFSGNVTSWSSGVQHSFSNVGPLDAGDYLYYESIRDTVEQNYATPQEISFTIVLSLFVNVLPQTVVRHVGRYR